MFKDIETPRMGSFLTERIFWSTATNGTLTAHTELLPVVETEKFEC